MKALMSKFLVAVALLSTLSSFAKNPKEKLTADEIVSRHLQSVGSSEAIAAAKSRVAQGAIKMEVVMGPAVRSQGTVMLASRGRQFMMRMQFPDAIYADEEFQFDGKDVSVSIISPHTRSETRSRLGDWLNREDVLIRETLLGGSLTTSWSMLDIKGRQAKLEYQGLKKIDGQELHDVIYRPKKGDTSLTIHLYFEPETFRHVRSVYTMAITADADYLHKQADISGQRGHAADRLEKSYKLEESFSDFKTVDGITLPSHWILQYTQEEDKTLSIRFDMVFADVKHNAVVD